MVNANLINKITDTHKFITVEILKRVLKGEVRISYSELESLISKQFGVQVNAHFSVPNKIGLISEICYELGLPMLSMIVVNNKTQMPGDGFYKLYDKLHDTHYAGNPVFEEKIRNQIKNEILNCKDWNKLTNFMGIEVEGINNK